MKKVRDNISKNTKCECHRRHWSSMPAKPKENHLSCGNLGDFWRVVKKILKKYRVFFVFSTKISFYYKSESMKVFNSFFFLKTPWSFTLMQTNKQDSSIIVCLTFFPPSLLCFQVCVVCWYLISVQLFLALSCFAETVLFFLRTNTTKKTAFVETSFLLWTCNCLLYVFGRTQQNILLQIIHFKPALFSERNKHSSFISTHHGKCF